MSSIDQRVHELFEANRVLFDGLPVSFDGVVDEENYMSSSKRVSFLLKDINGEETAIENGVKITRKMTEDWEYMKWLYEQATEKSKKLYKTWPNVCLWVELLKKPTCSYTDCLNAYGSFDDQRLRENLREISIINIKKTPGGGGSVYDEIKEAAERGRSFIRDEVQIVNPQIIICGGTFDFAETIFEVENEKICTLPSGTHYFKWRNCVALEFVHPMWFSVDRKILFAYAKEVFSEIKELL